MRRQSSTSASIKKISRRNKRERETGKKKGAKEDSEVRRIRGAKKKEARKRDAGAPKKRKPKSAKRDWGEIGSEGEEIRLDEERGKERVECARWVGFLSPAHRAGEPLLIFPGRAAATAAPDSWPLRRALV